MYRQDKLGLQCNINNSIINVSIQSDRLRAQGCLFVTLGKKDRVDSWLQCEISCYFVVSAVTCGSRTIAPSSLVTMSVIECEKIGQWRFNRK